MKWSWLKKCHGTAFWNDLAVVQSLSHVQAFATPWTTACQASLSSQTFLRLMSVELVILSNHLIYCHSLLCLQSLPASGSFPLSQIFASGGQSTGVSASAPVLSMNIQGWYPLGLTGWIPLQSKELSRVFHNTTVQKHQFFSAQPSLWSSCHIQTWPLGKPTLISKHDYWLYLTIWPLSHSKMNHI